MTHTKELKSNRKKDALKYLPTALEKIRNPLLSLPTTETIEDSYGDESDLECQGIPRIIIPTNINVFYTRLEVLLGIKLSSHSKTPTEACRLEDELYTRVNIQNERQYRNALYKFHNQ